MAGTVSTVSKFVARFGTNVQNFLAPSALQASQQRNCELIALLYRFYYRDKLNGEGMLSALREAFSSYCLQFP